MSDKVNHPAHYGGAANVYEAIKVIRAWALGFALGNAVKYIARAGRKPGESALDDLCKARWYLDNEIQTIDAAAGRPPAAVHPAAATLMLGMREILCELAYRNAGALAPTTDPHICRTLKLRSIEPEDVVGHVPVDLGVWTTDERKAWATKTVDSILLPGPR